MWGMVAGPLSFHVYIVLSCSSHVSYELLWSDDVGSDLQLLQLTWLEVALSRQKW
jgi:hypothetical protein